MIVNPAFFRSLSSLTGLSSPLSAVHRGVAFEERCLRVLQNNLSMTLHRVGGKSDGGIDLQGWWWLPTSDESLHHHHTKRRRIRVFAQCKAEKKKISPKYVREMEGVVLRHLPRTHDENIASEPTHSLPAQDLKDPVVGVFLSSSKFSKATLLCATSSPIPFMLLHLPEHLRSETKIPPTFKDESTEPDGDSEFGSMFFNPALGSSSGLLAGEVEARWEHSPQGFQFGRPGLWWSGQRIPSWTPDSAEQS